MFAPRRSVGSALYREPQMASRSSSWARRRALSVRPRHRTQDRAGFGHALHAERRRHLLAIVAAGRHVDQLPGQATPPATLRRSQGRPRAHADSVLQKKGGATAAALPTKRRCRGRTHHWSSCTNFTTFCGLKSQCTMPAAGGAAVHKRSLLSQGVACSAVRADVRRRLETGAGAGPGAVARGRVLAAATVARRTHRTGCARS